jgi:hypothetical protein
MQSHKSEHNIRLTTSEIGSLWSKYQNDSMVICVMKHFLEKVEDSEVKPIIEYALSLSEKHVQMISAIFKHENHPFYRSPRFDNRAT